MLRFEDAAPEILCVVANDRLDATQDDALGRHALDLVIEPMVDPTELFVYPPCPATFRPRRAGQSVNLVT